jgi:hypothetical protein
MSTDHAEKLKLVARLLKPGVHKRMFAAGKTAARLRAEAEHMASLAGSVYTSDPAKSVAFGVRSVMCFGPDVEFIVRFHGLSASARLAVIAVPALSDDFSPILRRASRFRAGVAVVVVAGTISTAIPVEAVRNIFAMNNVTLVTSAEVGA